MTGLLGPNGQPISTRSFKKTSAPRLGESYGMWSGDFSKIFELPGGGVLRFDLTRLTIADYRTMRDHYQINASLAVLTFMLHQLDWRIEADNKKMEDHCTENLEYIWTRLIRAFSQSFWAGFSPCALQWENDMVTRSVRLTKVKDLYPEQCRVHWKWVEGAPPPGGKVGPKFPVYDGIDQFGYPTIPVANSLWYPLLMENGDYNGRKLLRAAYVPWFFSQLIHLYTNRYFERFGEPTPVGRAPFDDTIDVPQPDNAPPIPVKGVDLMSSVLRQIRNRSVVVLPSDKQLKNDGSPTDRYLYDIEYLESQMRGADFERYLSVIDEEISLALFTPLLIMRTGNVGSYNLGVGHMQVYFNMLNALAGDLTDYIQKYILWPMVKYNFTENAQMPKIVFRKLGKDNVETMKAVMQAVIQGGIAKPDLDELSAIVGLTMKESRILQEPPSDNPSQDQPASNPSDKPKPTQTKAAALDIKKRVHAQVEKAFKSGRFGVDFVPSLGFMRRFERSLEADGFLNTPKLTNEFYERMDHWTADVVKLGQSEFSNPEVFNELFSATVDREINRLTEAS